jgi:hypothetical protein
MTDHVSSVYRTSYYHFQNIRSLKPFLSEEALVTVVHAFVTYRIDYGHSLLYGISEHNIDRLRRIQNKAARMLTNTRKYSHVKPAFQKLLWLPVKHRIQFKIVVTTY